MLSEFFNANNIYYHWWCVKIKTILYFQGFIIIQSEIMNLDYYIRNTVGSFLAIVILAAVIRFTLWEYTPEQYELVSTIFGTLLFFLGLVAVGYLNAKHAPDSKFKQSSIVHLIFVLFTFITDLLFVNSETYIVILRNVCYLAALQIGAFLFVKRQSRNLHFSK